MSKTYIFHIYFIFFSYFWARGPGPGPKMAAWAGPGPGRPGPIKVTGCLFFFPAPEQYLCYLWTDSLTQRQHQVVGVGLN